MCKRYAAVLCGAFVLSATVGSAKDKNHHDAFIPGDANDGKIAEELRHQLVSLPYYGVFDDLAFRVDGSMVTLLGQVVNPVLKDDAAGAAKRVPGVTQVVNNIEVLPVSPMDNQIRRAVYAAIFGDPALSDQYRYDAIPPIHIIVKNGHVTLEGVVANQFDKNLINTKANTVPNVFSVQNDLQVETSGK